ncbi:MAG: hypothetical protein JHC82_17405, partial [Stenotrophomonas sp.]|nr:hypothetical protein [Stenotrophomonas sp.]
MMHSMTRPLLLAAATLALAACTSVGSQKTPAPDVAYTVSPAAERAEAARVQALQTVAEKDPKNVESRVQ